MVIRVPGTIAFIINKMKYKVITNMHLIKEIETLEKLNALGRARPILVSPLEQPTEAPSWLAEILNQMYPKKGA